MAVSPDHDRPVLGVSVLVVHDGKVLLVGRGQGLYAGLWALPGGRVEPGETLANAAAREVGEETGLEIAVGDAIDRAEIIHSNRDGSLAAHYVLFVFSGEYVSGDPAAASDADDAGWFSTDQADMLDLTPDTRRILKKYVRG